MAEQVNLDPVHENDKATNTPLQGNRTDYILVNEGHLSVRFPPLPYSTKPRTQFSTPFIRKLMKAVLVDITTFEETPFPKCVLVRDWDLSVKYSPNPTHFMLASPQILPSPEQPLTLGPLPLPGRYVDESKTIVHPEPKSPTIKASSIIQSLLMQKKVENTFPPLPFLPCHAKFDTDSKTVYVDPKPYHPQYPLGYNYTDPLKIPISSTPRAKPQRTCATQTPFANLPTEPDQNKQTQTIHESVPDFDPLYMPKWALNVIRANGLDQEDRSDISYAETIELDVIPKAILPSLPILMNWFGTALG